MAAIIFHGFYMTIFVIIITNILIALFGETSRTSELRVIRCTTERIWGDIIRFAIFVAQFSRPGTWDITKYFYESFLTKDILTSELVKQKLSFIPNQLLLILNALVTTPIAYLRYWITKKAENGKRKRPTWAQVKRFFWLKLFPRLD